ncbi:hypothetical protein QZH41_020264 [Actinostola sp. cb2023]|nr:hypothetical protein QZH41_020264 [Actinostola sp. cb2023]
MIHSVLHYGLVFGHDRRSDKMASVTRTLAVFGRSATRFRCVRKSMLRAGYEEGPGMNMPFQTKNKTRLLIVMCSYLGTCFALPFVAVRFQMHKQAGD